jgi:alkaline phosphatase D
MQWQNLYTAIRYTALCTVLGCVLLLGACAASAQPPHTPLVTHGISAGDVTSTSAVIWARTDRNAHMHVLLHGDTPPALHTTPVHAAHDYAGKILLTHLRPNTTYRYTVWFTDTPPPHTERPPGVHGTFRTAPLPSSPQAVTFAWSRDLAGQNVCRDAIEGFATLRAVNALVLDFFIGLGDIIYADNACTATGLYGNAQVPGDFGPP